MGVGINVFPPEQGIEPAGKYRSAYLCADHPVKENLSETQRDYMGYVLKSLLHEMTSAYDLWCAKGFDPFVEEYTAHLAFVGRWCALESLDGTPHVQGMIRGVDAQGRLVVEDSVGHLVSASSGEVHVHAIDGLEAAGWA